MARISRSMDQVVNICSRAIVKTVTRLTSRQVENIRFYILVKSRL